MDTNDLIRRAKNGDLEAFNKVVLAFQELVYNQAYRMLGDEYAAEDAAQSAFIRAYMKLATYRGGSFRAWLLRIATNICYDELRRRNSHPWIALEPLNEYGEERKHSHWMADESALPEELVERMEVQETIQHCLEQIPAGYRAALILVDIQGLSYKETAAALDVPIGTVKSRLARGRALIGHQLLASPNNSFESWIKEEHNAESLAVAVPD